MADQRCPHPGTPLRYTRGAVTIIRCSECFSTLGQEFAPQPARVRTALGLVNPSPVNAGGIHAKDIDDGRAA